MNFFLEFQFIISNMEDDVPKLVFKLRTKLPLVTYFSECPVLGIYGTHYF